MEPGKINSIFFDQFPFPIIWMDLEGTIINSNFATKKISGYGKKDLIGRKFTEIVVNPQESLSLFEKIHTTLSKGDSLEPIEIQIYKKDGNLIWLNIQGALVQLGDKNFTQLIIQDNTDQKKKEERPKEFEEKYRLIIENANDMIAIIDENLKYIYANEAHFYTLGYKPDELIGNSRIILIHPDDIEEGIKYFKKEITKVNGKGMMEVRIKHKNGFYKWLEIRGRSFTGKNGKINAILISRDISERKEYEKAIKDSEEKYRIIAENANDLIAIVNRNFEFEYINEPLFFSVLGYKNGDLIGKSGFDLIHPDDIKLAINTIEKGKDNREGIAQLRLKSKNGGYRRFELKGRAFEGKDGKTKAIIIARDTTERWKLIEEIGKQNKKLKESEEKYRLITENANDLITVLNEKFEIEYMNVETHRRILGTAIQDEKRVNRLDQIHPDDIERIVTLAIRCFDKEELAKETVRIRHHNGYYIWFEAQAKMFVDRKGEKKLITIARDITDRKEAEEANIKLFEEIKRQNEELKELDQLKDEFYGDITHELRTPLIAVRGFTELLLNSTKLDNGTKEDLQVILKNELRLECLIDELLNYSLLKSGKIQLQKEPFGISGIVNEIKDEFKLIIKQKRLVFEEKFILDKELVLDKQQIMKVIRNILSNAIKFSLPWGTIFIKSRIEEGLWTFSIQDQGIGIPEKDIPNLFSRFIKLKHTEYMNPGGFGIGLTICKKIIDLYNGKIWVESDGLNKGSTFFFQINLNDNKFE